MSLGIILNVGPRTNRNLSGDTGTKRRAFTCGTCKKYVRVKNMFDFCSGLAKHWLYPLDPLDEGHDYLYSPDVYKRRGLPRPKSRDLIMDFAICPAF